MFETCKLNNGSTLLEFDRTQTKDYILDTVDIGQNESNFSLLAKKQQVGLERDQWHYTLSTITFTFWVLFDESDVESLQRRKMRLNRFFVPTRKVVFVGENSFSNMRLSFEFMLLRSVQYGGTEETNNDHFCHCNVVGQYDQRNMKVEALRDTRN